MEGSNISTAIARWAFGLATAYAFMILENKLFLVATPDQTWTLPGGSVENTPEAVTSLMSDLGFQFRYEGLLRRIVVDSGSQEISIHKMYASSETCGIRGDWTDFKRAFELVLEPWVKDTILFFLLAELPSVHFIEIDGSAPILLTAPHGKGPHADRNVGRIAERVAHATGAHAIIGRVTREVLDLNRTQSIDHPFRIRIEELRREIPARYILDIHGKQEETHKPDIDLGTHYYQTATKETVMMIKETLESFNLDVEVDRKFSGGHPGTVVQVHSNLFFAPITEAVQIEIEETFRFQSPESFEEIIQALVAVVERLKRR